MPPPVVWPSRDSYFAFIFYSSLIFTSDKEVMFLLVEFYKNYSKLLLNFFGRGGAWLKKKSLYNVGADPDQGADPGMFFHFH